MKQKQLLNQQSEPQHQHQQQEEEQPKKSVFSAAAERLFSITSNADPLAPHSFSLVHSSSPSSQSSSSFSSFSTHNTHENLSWDEEGEGMRRKDLENFHDEDEEVGGEEDEDDEENVSFFLSSFLVLSPFFKQFY